MAGWTTLVQPETLAIGIDRRDLVVVDCRFSLVDPSAGESAFRQSHVPGAVYAHLDRDLSRFGAVGAGRHPWPEAQALQATIERWSVTRDAQVVVYDDADGAIAARLWFLLKVAGHEKVAVLDGGWKRWVSLGLPTESFVRQRMPSHYAIAFDRSRLADATEVRRHLDAGGLVLDARAPARFRGDEEPLDRVAGHVPGARNHPYAGNSADGRLRSPVALAEDYRAVLGERPGADVIAMCGSGVTACHLLLAMERAGIRGARLYPGSWSEWITDPSRPVATGDA